MIDLCKKVLPSTVIVDGEAFEIKTEFSYWLRFLLDRKHNQIKSFEDFECLFDGERPKDHQAAFNALCDFCDRRNPLPRNVGSSDGRIIFDYEVDADLIYSAFWDCYGINLLKEKLHWYEFNALFDGLHDTKFNQVMGIRSYDRNDKSTSEQNAERLRQAWEIEVPLTEEEQKALDEFDAKLKC